MGAWLGSPSLGTPTPGPGHLPASPWWKGMMMMEMGYLSEFLEEFGQILGKKHVRAVSTLWWFS